MFWRDRDGRKVGAPHLEGSTQASRASMSMQSSEISSLGNYKLRLKFTVADIGKLTSFPQKLTTTSKARGCFIRQQTKLSSFHLVGHSRLERLYDF